MGILSFLGEVFTNRCTFCGRATVCVPGHGVEICPKGDDTYHQRFNQLKSNLEADKVRISDEKYAMMSKFQKDVASLVMEVRADIAKEKVEPPVIVEESSP